MSHRKTVSRINCGHPFRSGALVFFLTISAILSSLVACVEDGESDASSSEGRLSFALPSNRVLRVLPEEGTARALLFIDQETQPQCMLTPQAADERVECMVDGLSTGTHSVRLRWEFNDQDFEPGRWWKITGEINRNVDIQPGRVTSVNFNSNEYTYPDEDGDSFSNWKEIKDRTHPGNTNDPVRTPPSASVNPASGTVITTTQAITITFDRSMQTDSLVLSGNMAGESNGGLWSANTSNDDTLTISPASQWSEGSGRTLAIDASDLRGVQLEQLLLTYTIQSDEPKVVFVTSTRVTGNLGSSPDANGETGLAAGDAICRARAAAAGRQGNFVAWLSDEGNDAYCRVHNLSGKKSDNCGQSSLPNAAGPWVRTDGEPFAAAIDQLTRIAGGVVYTPIRKDEAGNNVQADTFIFTGTDQFGVFDTMSGELVLTSCGNWNTADEQLAGSGTNEGTTNFWTEVGRVSCGTERPLLCMQTGVGTPLKIAAPAGKKVFVTSTFGNGNLSSWTDSGGLTGLAAGDAICQNLAAKANLANANTFKAWLSNSTTDAKDRLQTTGSPWVRLDGIKIADNEVDLLTNSPFALFTAITVDEKGNYLVNRGVWTGTSSLGIKTNSTCSDWTNGAADQTGTGGRTGFAGSGSPFGWSDESPDACNIVQHLYCFED